MVNGEFTTPRNGETDDIRVAPGTARQLVHRSTALLVGGTCHVEKPNSLGSCERGENTPARVVHVSMPTSRGGGCLLDGEGRTEETTTAAAADARRRRRRWKKLVQKPKTT